MSDIPFLDQLGDEIEVAIRRRPQPRGRPLVLKLGLAASVVAIVLIAYVVASGGSPAILDRFHSPYGYAGWTPHPNPVDPVLEETAVQLCTNPATAGAVLPHLVVIDQRGKTAVALLAYDVRVETCILVRDSGRWQNARARTISVVPGAPFGSIGATYVNIVFKGSDVRRVSTLITITGYKAGDVELTAVSGHIREGVGSVEVARRDADSVAAVLRDGFFIAWWPQDNRQTVEAVVAFGADGAELVRMKPWAQDSEMGRFYMASYYRKVLPGRMSQEFYQSPGYELSSDFAYLRDDGTTLGPIQTLTPPYN